jgi:hypothetical protein
MPSPTSLWQKLAGPLAGVLVSGGCYMFAAGLAAGTFGAGLAVAGACTALGGMAQRSVGILANGGSATEAISGAFEPRAVLTDFVIGAGTFAATAGISAGASKLRGLTQRTRSAAPTELLDDATQSLTNATDNLATNATEAVESTRVGRWMSPEEHAAMTRTGEVQVGAGGTTSVASPPNAESFMRQTAPESHYVEFDVPSNSVFPGGTPEWGQIPGPDHILGRLAAKRGITLPSPVTACNIVHVATKLGGGAC